jgi:hypothetical protein
MHVNPNDNMKKQCFEEVTKFVRTVYLLWMMIRDLNEILMAS